MTPMVVRVGMVIGMIMALMVIMVLVLMRMMMMGVVHTSIITCATLLHGLVKKPQSHTTEAVYENEILSVQVDHLNLGPNQPDYPYTYITRRQNGVSVIPYFPQTDEVLLVSQYRHTLGRIVWQFPGGSMESDQDSLATAKTELLEETGYEATELIDLGVYQPDIGILKNEGGVFLAINPEQTDRAIQNTVEESTEIKIFSVSELKQMVNDGKIRDGWSLGSIALFLLWQEQQEAR